MNSQIIRIAENAHEFFLQYPKAIADFKIQVDAKTVPELFHFAHEQMVKERNEHTDAKLNAKDVRSTIRQLGKSLRSTAYALEKGVNVVLDLENREDEEVDFVRGTDFALSLDEFVVQLSHFENIIKQNSSYERSFTKFKQELSAYKAAASQIGDSKIVADMEKQEFLDILDHYEPIIAALHTMIKRYLSKTDKELLALYKEGLAYKTSSKSKPA